MPPFYRPPADINDFDRRPALNAALRDTWSRFIAGVISGRATGGGLVYDAAVDPTPGTAPARQPVPWNGFPRSIWQWFNADADPAGKAKAFAAAETLRDLGQVPLSTGASIQLFERQQVLYFEGAQAERVWVVASGEVRLYKSSPSGQITTLDVLGEGEEDRSALGRIEQHGDRLGQ